MTTRIPYARALRWTGAPALALAVAFSTGDAVAQVPPPPRTTAWQGTWATVPTAVPASNVTTFEDQTTRQVVHISVGGGELPERTEGRTIHAFAFQHNVVAAGNVTGAAAVTPSSVIEQWYFLSGVSVRARRNAAPVVALGDSITDGGNTTTDADRRWPDLLAARLHGTRGVLNEGISGNRLLHDPNPPPGSDAEAYAAYFGESALRRFDRDVGAQPGARYVIVLLGVNDLGRPGTVAPASEKVTAADLIGGYRQLIARAHQRGLKIFGATIMPFKNDTLGFYTPAREAVREAVNRWIRTSREYDGVVGFDAATRDPDHPRHLRPAYDSGDHLHPNDAGAAAMADAVPPEIFR